MQTEFLIVGQGICGTFLSRELQKAGRSFIIVDKNSASSASKVASGIINPITGRRMVKTWMIDELLPFAVNAYREIGEYLNIGCLSQKDIIDCFPTAQMRLAFLDKFAEDPQYLALPEDENDYQPYLQYGLGYGIISPCYLADLQQLLPAYRKKLPSGCLLEASFDLAHLELKENHVLYKDIKADRIIFCDGRNSFNNPWFARLPFALSKGEALIAAIPGLPRDHIYKKGLSIVPWQDDLFWIGSSYEWEFEDDQPTAVFRERITRQLEDLLLVPFTIVDHIAALRPGTLERRPFAGWHPSFPRIGIFNGMGTKGCSLAPYFARQFADSIVHNTALLPAADVQRFKKVLSR